MCYKALAQLKPDVNVIGLAPISENLPSGTATKPGDIVRFYNGKTAEIRNTDAEGRLILADALSYAVKHYKLDAIIDIATLTGACAHALGPFFTGIMGQHDGYCSALNKQRMYLVIVFGAYRLIMIIKLQSCAMLLIFVILANQIIKQAQ